MPTTYTQAQIGQYLNRVGYPLDTRGHPSPTLETLGELQKRHLSRVPFENVSLHYSKHRLLSLDEDDLFEKIVLRNHGGYCMEVNALFAVVLRSLGFNLISTGGRVGSGDSTSGLSHMANIVTIDGQKYWVDVGFGSNCAVQPVPLRSGTTFSNIPPAQGMLEYRSTSRHSDPTQKLWVFSLREDAEAPWKEMYSFIDIEFFPADFEVMNLSTMTSPRSYFVRTVLAARMLLDEEDRSVEGVLTLHKDVVKRRIGRDTETLEELKTEEERVQALAKYFGIALRPDEERAIKGLPTELAGQR